MAGYGPLFSLPLLNVFDKLIFNLVLYNIVTNLVLHHRVSYSFGITAAFANEGLWECSCKTKIAYSYLTPRVDQDVCWLDIPVNDVGGMTVTHGAK